MSDLFRKKAFEFTDVTADDKGVYITKALELIKFSKFYKEFYIEGRCARLYGGA